MLKPIHCKQHFGRLFQVCFNWEKDNPWRPFIRGMLFVMKKEPADLRRRLKRLGRHRSKKPKSLSSAFRSIQGLPEGDIIETSFGSTYRLEERFSSDHQHGHFPLSHTLTFPTQLVAEVVRKPELGTTDLDQLMFLDTETTGLAGGAGTLVFLVGIGYFQDREFFLRQYFLRDPAEEMGMLDLLHEDLQRAAGYVTYNGQAFDLPLLENRYVVALKRRLSLVSSPNLDLLHLTRRLWKESLPDCTLSTVERHVLGVERSDADVPGSWIPGMYLDYLRTGDASEMSRVIYHNFIDVLSLVSLTGQVLARFEGSDPVALSGGEALAVARWHQDFGRGSPAELAFKRAVDSSKVDLKIEALRRYSAYLKREGRRVEAVKLWRKWHELSPEDDRPCIELAKFYEWEIHDYLKAMEWSQRALQCLTHWPGDWRRERNWGEIEHRIKRLDQKLESQEHQRES